MGARKFSFRNLLPPKEEIHTFWLLFLFFFIYKKDQKPHVNVFLESKNVQRSHRAFLTILDFLKHGMHVLIDPEWYFVSVE